MDKKICDRLKKSDSLLKIIGWLLSKMLTKYSKRPEDQLETSKSAAKRIKQAEN